MSDILDGVEAIEEHEVKKQKKKKEEEKKDKTEEETENSMIQAGDTSGHSGYERTISDNLW